MRATVSPSGYVCIIVISLSVLKCWAWSANRIIDQADLATADSQQERAAGHYHHDKKQSHEWPPAEINYFDDKSSSQWNGMLSENELEQLMNIKNLIRLRSKQQKGGGKGRHIFIG